MPKRKAKTSSRASSAKARKPNNSVHNFDKVVDGWVHGSVEWTVKDLHGQLKKGLEEGKRVVELKSLWAADADPPMKRKLVTLPGEDVFTVTTQPDGRLIGFRPTAWFLTRGRCKVPSIIVDLVLLDGQPKLDHVVMKRICPKHNGFCFREETVTETFLESGSTPTSDEQFMEDKNFFWCFSFLEHAASAGGEINCGKLNVTFEIDFSVRVVNPGDMRHVPFRNRGGEPSPLGRRISSLLETSIMSDVVLKCEDHSFEAHRLILAAWSEVFAAMFSHASTKECQTGEIVIKDCNAETLETFLKYLYSGQPPTPKMAFPKVVELAVLADRYLVQDLKDVCFTHMYRYRFCGHKDSSCKRLFGLLLQCRPLREAVETLLHVFYSSFVFKQGSCKPEQLEGWKGLAVGAPDIAEEIVNFYRERQRIKTIRIATA